MKEKIELFAQILAFRWQLNAMIIQSGLKVVDIINEAKAFERLAQDSMERNKRRYQEIMQMRKKYEETKNNNRK